MPADVFDALEVLGYFGKFWAFLFSARVRKYMLKEFREASWIGKLFRLVEAGFATLIGLGPLVLAAWLIWGKAIMS
jgi:hypothetical protein